MHGAVSAVWKGACRAAEEETDHAEIWIRSDPIADSPIAFVKSGGLKSSKAVKHQNTFGVWLQSICKSFFIFFLYLPISLLDIILCMYSPP